MCDRFLRLKEVRTLTGLSTTTIWRLENQGLFPRRYRIGLSSVGWRIGEVRQWLDSRPRCRLQGPAEQPIVSGQ